MEVYLATRKWPCPFNDEIQDLKEVLFEKRNWLCPLKRDFPDLHSRHRKINMELQNFPACGRQLTFYFYKKISLCVQSEGHIMLSKATF